MDAHEAQITIRRSGHPVRDVLRFYKIYVDGRRVGKVWRNRSAAVSVSPGIHRVQLKVDWGFSPELEVAVAEGDQINLRCMATATAGISNAGSELRKSFREPIIALELIGADNVESEE